MKSNIWLLLKSEKIISFVIFDHRKQIENVWFARFFFLSVSIPNWYLIITNGKSESLEEKKRRYYFFMQLMCYLFTFCLFAKRNILARCRMSKGLKSSFLIVAVPSANGYSPKFAVFTESSIPVHTIGSSCSVSGFPVIKITMHCLIFIFTLHQTFDGLISSSYCCSCCSSSCSCSSSSRFRFGFRVRFWSSMSNGNDTQ